MDADLSERVEKILTRYSMQNVRGRLGVAVSGGGDSVVLLHLLHRLLAQAPVELLVLHINHGLRGAESDSDEAFVRALAESLRLPIAVDRTPLGPGNTEQAAREIRRSFFRSIKDREGLHAVALGHTRSDQAETVLFRLLRGSGLAGLAGMQTWTPEGLLRPLLGASREEVRKWGSEQGITWREDSSNADVSFTRNHLRIRTMPMLKEAYNPNLEGTLAQVADLAQAEEEFWDGLVGRAREALSPRATPFGMVLPVRDLSALHLALRRRVLRRLISDVRGDLRGIDAPHVGAILALCDQTDGHNRVLVPGVDAIRSFGTLLLTGPGALSAHARGFELPVKDYGQYKPPPAGSILLQPGDSRLANCAKFKTDQYQIVETADLDAEALGDGEGRLALTLRNWEPGDQIWRIGQHRPEKLKVLFQQFQVLLWERRHWPVLALRNQIVWARLFGPAAPFVRSADSKSWIRLTYAGPLG